MRIWTSIALAVGVSACAQPVAKIEPLMTQHKVYSARDWHSLADRTATQLVKNLSKVEDFDPSGHMFSEHRIKSLASRSFYITTNGSDSPFAKIFTPLLEEVLLKKGYVISDNPRNSTVINYNTQTYYYGGNHGKRAIDYASFWTTAAALGILAADKAIDDGSVVWGSGTAALVVAAVGPILDTMIARGEVTEGEVVLHTTVVGPKAILQQSSEAFYIKPSALPFYWSTLPENAPLETVKMQPVVSPNKTIPIVR